MLNVAYNLVGGLRPVWDLWTGPDTSPGRQFAQP
jgi:hypothetical protein